MFDNFLFLTILASIGLSFCLAPIGCFLIWRRQAFFADAISHSAILGVAVGLVFGTDAIWSIIGVCIVLSSLLAYGPRLFRLPSDTWLGLLSYTLISIGYIIMKTLSQKTGRNYGSVEHFLFGDLFLVNAEDIIKIVVSCVVCLCFLFIYWKPLVLMTLDEESAKVSRVPTTHLTFLLLSALSVIVAVTLPLIGALLVPGLLLIPGSCSTQMAHSPEGVIFGSVIVALIMTMSGIGLSMIADWPVSPSIIITGFVMFSCLSLLKNR